MMKGNDDATVSVVMCTYNGELFVREQIESILAQTYPIAEFIVQDDNSTDNTWNICMEYAKRIPAIRLMRNDGERGVNNNFFSAMRKATSDYIAISDQDDIWEPDKIACQVRAIGDKLLCSGLSKPFTNTGAPIRVDLRIPNYNLLRLVSGHANTLPGHTMLFRRELLNKCPLSLTLGSSYDASLSIGAAAFGSIAFVNQVLVNQRRHVGACTFTPPTDNRKTITNIFGTMAKTFSLYRELKQPIRRHLTLRINYLSQIHSENPIIRDALKMLRLYTSTSSSDFFRLLMFCAKHGGQLYTYQEVGEQKLLTWLKGAYFPIFMCKYYRGMSKRQHTF
jgi:glycosyltransferase involved in cell wall biosynthesis